MFKRNTQGNVRAKLVAGAVLLALGFASAGSAVAATAWTGGATLPAGAYVGFNFLSSGFPKQSSANITGTVTSTIASNSLFGAYIAPGGTGAGTGLSYCQTGSGGGKKVFDHFDGTSVISSTGTCDGTALTFGAPAGTAINPHIAGSDAPMSSSEYAGFASGGRVGTFGEPSQFPAVAGSIAIVYHKAGSTGTLNLTDDQICRVMNGSTATWGALLGTSDTTPIRVVYRSDGSGTTFSFSNHLTAPSVCATSTSSNHFVTDQAFTTVISQFSAAVAKLPPASGTVPVTAWIPANGNGDVIAKIEANDGTIGYAEAANFLNAPNKVNTKAATVNGRDPFAQFPSSLTVTALGDRAVSGVNLTTGAPVLSAITPHVAASCLFVVDPTTYANVTTNPDGSARYPIMAVSYLIANFKGNGSDLAAVRGLVGQAYVSGHPGVTTIGANTGYAFVAAAIPQARIPSCIGA